MPAPTNGRALVFAEEFDGAALDRSVWLPHYLPAWSSKAATAATYALGDSCLHLTIPTLQGLWCADTHQPSMRVSAVQTGSFSGPVGSTVGQQPFRAGLVVREEQEPFWGWIPDGGYIEMRARGRVTPRSMVSFWMVGVEDEPARCAEICVFEVFGDAVAEGASAAVGMGVHAFRDPAAIEDFAAPRLSIDVAEFHTYAVDWTPERAEFLVDGEVVRHTDRPPAYPMQLMVGVFDFPEKSVGEDADAVPALVIDHVRGYAAH